MRRVIIESPYASNNAWLPGFLGRWLNRRYARKCMLDSLMRGESPYASHLLYTQRGILSDQIKEERALGIAAGFAWRCGADVTAIYIDRGISEGMLLGIEHAQMIGQEVIYRSLCRKTRLGDPKMHAARA